MIDLILKYFPDLTEKQIEQFSKVGDLYKEWNDQINVVSRKDIDEIYTNHILHSLAIAKVMEFADGSSVLDVGTGGGLPGIPLAILCTNVKFHLVDSIGKKIKVVKGVADGLGLTNVKAEQKRAEELTDKYDFVVSRAVTAMPRFAEWIRGKFKKEVINVSSMENTQHFGPVSMESQNVDTVFIIRDKATKRLRAVVQVLVKQSGNKCLPI